MKGAEGLKRRVLSASGTEQAQLVLKHARVLNVFTEELESVDVAVTDGYITGIGEYQGEEEVDLFGKILCPGFIDGHIHLESSMVTPLEFEQAVLPHGTTTVVTDPHEIANVAGICGIDYMLKATEDLFLEVYFMMPSCVPATDLDESGACLQAEDLKTYYKDSRVLGLAEMMDSYGTVMGRQGILEKIYDAKKAGKEIDGHAPGLEGKALNAYIAAGVHSDHECSDAKEAMNKLKRGQWIMIREGTAAKNLNALMPLFESPFYHRCLLVTDDKHPGDLIRYGHMDYIIKKAIEWGADPIHAIKMGSFHAACYFGLKHLGAIAPGFQADLVVLSDLESIRVEQVYKAGKLVAEKGSVCADKIGLGNTADWLNENIKEKVFHSFHMDELKTENLQFLETGEKRRVFCLTPGQLLTTEKIVPWCENKGFAKGVDVDLDIIKMAVVERHRSTGHIGLGFLGGYGLKKGAVASSIAHDSHNLIIAGTSDEDMVLAGNTVRNNQGGLAVVADGRILGELALPIAGLMSPLTVNEVEKQLEELKKMARELGISEEIDPFMTLSFTSLPVIPKLRLNTFGLIDTKLQKAVNVMVP